MPGTTDCKTTITWRSWDVERNTWELLLDSRVHEHVQGAAASQNQTINVRLWHCPGEVVENKMEGLEHLKCVERFLTS